MLPGRSQILSILLRSVFVVCLYGPAFLKVNASEFPSVFSSQTNMQTAGGYTAVALYKDGFIASGTDGRIDMISGSGAVIKSDKFPGEKFNCVISHEKTVVAAGEGGIIMITDDKGIFRKQDTKTNENINSLEIFRNNIIAGADHGEIISGDLKGLFRKTKLPLRGNIVSVSSRESDCFGVTDEGEIIHSTDGIKWNITDFNKVYSGYYNSCYFKKILVTENRIAIIGSHTDGTPVVMLSTQGNVWTERTLVFTDDQGYNTMLEELPNDIIYDEQGEQFWMICNKGKVMQLPSCNHCNKVTSVADVDLKGSAINGPVLMIVGNNFILNPVRLF